MKNTLFCLSIVCGLAGAMNAYASDNLNSGPFNPPKDDNVVSAISDMQKQEELEKLQHYQQQKQQADAQLNSALGECKKLYDVEKTQAHVPLVNCFNHAIMAIYQHADYPYMDLIQSVNNKRLEVWQRVDNKIMSEEAGRVELQQFSGSKIEEASRRDSELMKN